MEIERIREFQRFSNSLNFTQAAIELNLSQSNLSKHIRQIETEIGCDLIDRGAKNSLTPVGSHFLTRISQILNIYDELLEECAGMQSNNMVELVFQDPHMVDEATAVFCKMVETFHQKEPRVPIRFSRIRKNSLEDTLERNLIDVALVYESGGIDEVVEMYEKSGCFAKYLASEPAVIWGDASSELAKKPFLAVEDLKGIPIMTQSRTYDPYRNALLAVCEKSGFKPDLRFSKADVFYDFVFGESYDAFYFLPSSFKDDLRFKVKQNRVFIPFKEHAADIHVFAVMCYPENESQQLIYEFMFEGGTWDEENPQEAVALA